MLTLSKTTTGNHRSSLDEAWTVLLSTSTATDTTTFLINKMWKNRRRQKTLYASCLRMIYNVQTRGAFQHTALFSAGLHLDDIHLSRGASSSLHFEVFLSKHFAPRSASIDDSIPSHSKPFLLDRWVVRRENVLDLGYQDLGPINIINTESTRGDLGMVPTYSSANVKSPCMLALSSSSMSRLSSILSFSPSCSIILSPSSCLGCIC